MDNDFGWLETTFKAPCDLTDVKPTKEWLTKLLLQNPDYTGWPFFIDLWSPKKPEWKPRIRDGIWECRIDKPTANLQGIDYWRIDGRQGLFFVARTLEDDTSAQNPELGKTLEFALAILRTAELLAIAGRFSQYLCGPDGDDGLTTPIDFKWSKLRGRRISNWANRGRMLSGDYESNSDEVSTSVELPLFATRDQIALCTQKIVGDLFLAFDGWECPTSVVDDLVSRLLNRQLM